MSETSILILSLGGAAMIIGLAFYTLGYRDGRKKGAEIVTAELLPMLNEARDVLVQQATIINRQRTLVVEYHRRLAFRDVTQDNSKETLQ